MTENSNRITDKGKSRKLRLLDVLLLALPFVGLLFPSWYARWTPEFFGLPFFYAYQFAWVIISAGLIAIVYWRTRG